MERYMKGLLVAVVAVIVALPSFSYALGDEIALEGVPLREQEMNDIHGGFQMPNGPYLFFSMDVIHIKSVSDMNTLRQQAFITKDGIAFSTQMAQADSGGNSNGKENTAPSSSGSNAGTASAQPAANNAGAITVGPSFASNTGTVTANFLGNNTFTNANFNTGTGNVTQSIANLINIQVGFFTIKDASQAQSVLRNFFY
jgi:hypothetical protein